jgi:hypothetical protein
LKIRFYKYFFLGLDKPIIMEAENKNEADKMLVELQYKSQTPIDIKRLVDVRVETPIIGISKRKRKGKEYVWVGKEYTSDGWLEKEEYDKINNLNKK